MNAESRFYRIFVAIELPETVRAKLIAVQRELKSVMPRHSTAWPKPENLHLTMRFLGNVLADRVGPLHHNLATVLSEFGALNLKCERLGCFPDLRFPRVVWAWVHDATDRLQQLHQRIDAGVREFAEKPAEARFMGHVTLARPKQIKRADAERLAKFVEAAVHREFGHWQADEVLLLRSELSAAGSRYHELARISLRQNRGNTQSC